jgi:hypothetical protein
MSLLRQIYPNSGNARSAFVQHGNEMAMLISVGEITEM